MAEKTYLQPGEGGREFPFARTLEPIPDSSGPMDNSPRPPVKFAEVEILDDDFQPTGQFARAFGFGGGCPAGVIVELSATHAGWGAAYPARE